jgi:hypothetical protein
VRSARTALAAMLGAAALATTAGAAYLDGPPPAHTGGFGEPTCHRCHVDRPMNDPAGTLALAGWPDRYEPGRRYDLRLVLTRPGLARGGFELAVRYAGPGPRAGRQAGTLRTRDARAAVVTASGVAYARHTEEGTDPTAPDTVAWALEWEAPDGGGGLLVVHAAANAANDDASEFGDFIYTLEAHARPTP